MVYKVLTGNLISSSSVQEGLDLWMKRVMLLIAKTSVFLFLEFLRFLWTVFCDNSSVMNSEYDSKGQADYFWFWNVFIYSNILKWENVFPPRPMGVCMSVCVDHCQGDPWMACLGHWPTRKQRKRRKGKWVLWHQGN